MTRSRRAIYSRFLVMFVVLGACGIAATIFVLVNQRVRLPFNDVATVRAEFTAANGVLPGVGQPVNIVGVKVGRVTGVRVDEGVAVVTLQVEQEEVPQLYANASATLTPVSPLGDMQVELIPGDESAPKLPSGGTIGTGSTAVPVPLSDLLSRLDTDTRGYVSGLIAAVDRGTDGRAPDLRRLLLSLGPTVRQVGDISEALARRRTRLASFVHNVSRLTRAASQDGELQSVVAAGQQTLGAIAAEDESLKQAIRLLPSTLDAARRTLGRVPSFTQELTPTLTGLQPAVAALPSTLSDLGTLTDRAAVALRSRIRPLVRAANPVVRDAGAAVPALERAAPPLIGIGQTLNYTLNELNFVAGGRDQGFLFWAAWFMHNLNSAFSSGDANGAVVRAAAVAGCSPVQNNKAVQQALAPLGMCQG